jgi:hypothetical protein
MVAEGEAEQLSDASIARELPMGQQAASLPSCRPQPGTT